MLTSADKIRQQQTERINSAIITETRRILKHIAEKINVHITGSRIKAITHEEDNLEQYDSCVVEEIASKVVEALRKEKYEVRRNDNQEDYNQPIFYIGWN